MRLQREYHSSFNRKGQDRSFQVSLGPPAKIILPLIFLFMATYCIPKWRPIWKSKDIAPELHTSSFHTPKTLRVTHLLDFCRKENSVSSNNSTDQVVHPILAYVSKRRSPHYKSHIARHIRNVSSQEEISGTVGKNQISLPNRK